MFALPEPVNPKVPGDGKNPSTGGCLKLSRAGQNAQTIAQMLPGRVSLRRKQSNRHIFSLRPDQLARCVVVWCRSFLFQVPVGAAPELCSSFNSYVGHVHSDQIKMYVSYQTLTISSGKQIQNNPSDPRITDPRTHINNVTQ